MKIILTITSYIEQFAKMVYTTLHANQDTKNRISELSEQIKDITTLLGIKPPHIIPVDIIYKYNGINWPVGKYNDLCAPNLPLVSAYYNHTFNCIYIAGRERNKNINILQAVPSGALLYAFAHELRHVWQNMNNYMTPHSTNEWIHDPREIDADAFALIYLLSTHTRYKTKDFQCYMSRFSQDDHKRDKRAKELSDEYNLLIDKSKYLK